MRRDRSRNALRLSSCAAVTNPPRSSDPSEEVAATQELSLLDGHKLTVLCLRDHDAITHPDHGEVLVQALVQDPEPPFLAWEELRGLLQQVFGSVYSQKVPLVPELRLSGFSQLARLLAKLCALTTRSA
jgi:hypothetical protein